METIGSDASNALARIEAMMRAGIKPANEYREQDSPSESPASDMPAHMTAMAAAGVPPRQLPACAVAYPPGGNILIAGPPGVGKSYRAAGMLRQALADGGRARWFYVPMLLLRIRGSYNSQQQSEERIVNECVQPGFAVFDDALVRRSEHEYETLLVILARRYDDMKTTILTTNESSKAIEGHARLESRLAAFEVMLITGHDRRRGGRQ